MFRNELTPLGDINGGLGNRVSWELDLPPYVPVGDIGIDVASLDRIALIGGFRRLSIQGHNGETTKYVPEVDSLNASGEATSSMKVSVDKAKLQTTDVAYSPVSKYIARAVGTISINVPEIIDRVQKDTRYKGALRNPDCWSKVLNTAIAHGVRTATNKNLFSETTMIDKAFAGIYVGFSTNNIVNAANFEHAVNFPATLIMLSAVSTLAVRTRNKDERGNIPLTLWPALHLDRIASVEARTRLSKIVKPIK